MNLCSGVSDTERQRREESNHFGAKITFIAWLSEVFFKSVLEMKTNQKISGGGCSYTPSSLPPSSPNQVVETHYTPDASLILSSTRYMLWKIQSGIAPPFFYVVVAEQEKLKTLRSFLCRETQNAVEPIAQLPMYTVKE